MLSIVVPTKNEQDHLPLLLDSIKNQSFSDFEVIIADAGSTDKTVEIAKKYSCSVVPGGLPSKGRNQGAKVAKGDIVLFLDADTILPEDFFRSALAEFEEKKLEIASFGLLINSKNKMFHILSDLFYNYPIIALEKVLPHAACGILIKKELFEKLKGYDETIKLAEDHDLARRAGKISAKYGLLRSSKIFVSDRRFRKDGWLKTALKYFASEFHLIFLGPIRTDVFDYKFDHYEE